jgi:hypothetical protein
MAWTSRERIGDAGGVPLSRDGQPLHGRYGGGSPGDGQGHAANLQFSPREQLTVEATLNAVGLLGTAPA